MVDLFVVPPPQLDVREKLRFIVGKLSVCKLCCLARLHRAVARVLHRKGSGNDQHLGQAILFARRQNHASDTRIDWQLGECLAGGCQARVGAGFGVNRAEFLQQMVAVSNGPT